MSNKCVKLCKRSLVALIAVLVFSGTVSCIASGVDNKRNGWIVVGSTVPTEAPPPETDPPTEAPPAETDPPVYETDPPAQPPTENSGEPTQEPNTEPESQNNPAETAAGPVGNRTTTRTPTTTKARTTAAASAQEGVTVAVNFELNGGEGDYETILAPTKAHLYVPANPVREGYKFMGWFSDPEFTDKWDFEGTGLSADVTLYAKWVPLVYYSIAVDTGITGGTVSVNLSSATEGDQIEISVTPDDGMRVVKNSLTVNGERQKKLVFEMPACDVFISAQFEQSSGILASGASKKLVIVAGGVFLIIVTLAVYVILMRRRDPNTEEPDWQDDTIVLTGITKKDGKIVTPSENELPKSEADEDDSE